MPVWVRITLLWILLAGMAGALHRQTGRLEQARRRLTAPPARVSTVARARPSRSATLPPSVPLTTPHPPATDTLGADPATRPDTPSANPAAWLTAARETLARSRIENRVDEEYANFLRQMAPAQARQLRELLIAAGTNNSPYYLKLGNRNLTPAERNQILADIAHGRQVISEATAALLGEAGLQRLDEYRATRQDRRQVAALKETMYGAGLDLTAEQNEALVEMMRQARAQLVTAEEEPEMAALSRLLPEERGERGLTPQAMELRSQELYQARYLQGATNILSPPQMEMYEQFLRQQLDAAETQADYQPAPMPDYNDRATVHVGRVTETLATPVAVDMAQAAFSTWGNNSHGSSLSATNTAAGTLALKAAAGSGWGAGITFWPDHSVKNADDSVNAAGARSIVARVRAPAGVNLRVGLLESGAPPLQAQPFAGANGADGEAFRHEGITTTEGWQTYTIPLTDMKLNGGYGNQHGNRTIDAQAISGIEVLFPGGQSNTEMEIEWVRLE